MQGKLIVFEGTDGSGKATQSELLCQELTRRGVPYRKLTFPRYQEESSALVRLYLGGAFGQKPGDVNAYAAAAFYSVDRYASYKQDWGSYYEQGGLLIADSYTPPSTPSELPTRWTASWTPFRRSSSGPLWTGSLTSSIRSWVCPPRIVCCTWISPRSCPSR